MIILRQKEFNSKSMKALRKAWDLRQGLKSAATNPSIRSGKVKPVGEVVDKIRSNGRKLTKSVSTLPANVNESIELKRITGPLTTVADIKRSPLFVGQDLKKYKKSKDLLKYYDHGKRGSNPEYIAAMASSKKRT